jgi:TfoX/Sxy family transcriptional regulator of competence genes
MGNLPLLEEALDALPHTRRSMFGGHGAFAPNGGMFAAIVDGDRIALKLPRQEDWDAFLAEGAEPWVYDGRMSMAGWAVIPESLYDEPRRLAEWARRAHATAVPSKSKLARAKKAAGKKAAAKKASPKKAAKKAPGKKAASKKPASKKGASKRRGSFKGG